jgi:GNAT superfamily N-acetyltransferase
MTERIRPATESDLEAMAELAVAREAAYVRSVPGLSRAVQPDHDVDAVSVQRRVLASDMERGEHVALLAEDEGRVIGFALIGGIGIIPPRPADGVVTASLSAFDVEPDRWPTIGPALLGAVLDGAREHGVGLLTAQSMAPEAEKRRLFQAIGMRVTGESWWMPLEARGEAVETEPVETAAAEAGMAGTERAETESAETETAEAAGVRIRRASASDVDAMVALEAARRAQNVRRDPDFFALMTSEAAEVRRRVLTEWVGSPDADILVAEADGRPVGYTLIMLMDALGTETPVSTAAIHELDIEWERWPAAGRALLLAALDTARERGAEQVVAVVAVDPAWHGELEAAGMTIVLEGWYAKPGWRADPDGSDGSDGTNGPGASAAESGA